MEPRRPTVAQYTLEVFAEPESVKEVVKAILHTIFFHRYFIPIVPLCREILEQHLPAIDDVDLEFLIDQRATSLVRAIEAPFLAGNHAYSNNDQNGRAQIVVQFFEKKRKKTYFFGKGDEEVCWEQWTLDITCATPRSESERIKVKAAMEKNLQKTAMKIINIANRDKDHIPPITVAETNPFPYQIHVNPRSENRSQRINIF